MKFGRRAVAVLLGAGMLTGIGVNTAQAYDYHYVWITGTASQIISTCTYVYGGIKVKDAWRRDAFGRLQGLCYVPNR